MVFVFGQAPLVAVFVLIVKVLVAAAPVNGSVPSCETAGLVCEEMILFDSKASVVSPEVIAAVLPVLVLVGVLVVVVAVVVGVVGATQFTAVIVVVHVVWLDKPFNVLLTQPDMPVAANIIVRP